MSPHSEQFSAPATCPHGNEPGKCWYCEKGGPETEDAADAKPPEAQEQRDETPVEDLPSVIVEQELSQTTIGIATEKNETKGGKNEDAVLVDHRTRTYGVLDGMGGQAAGEVASSKATQFIVEGLARMPNDIRQDGARVAEHLQRAIEQASENILNMAGADPELAGMGATASIIHLVEHSSGAPREAIIANVGDSRVYRLRRGKLELLTKDQSFLQNLIDKGALPPDADQIGDAAADARLTEQQREIVRNRRNVVTGAVGARGMRVDVTRVPIESDDVLFATSDGVHDNLTDREIAGIAQQCADDPARLSAELARVSRERSRDTANVRHKDDDISAVAVRVRYAEDGPGGGMETPTSEPSPIPAETLAAWRNASATKLEQAAVEYRRILDETAAEGTVVHPNSISRAYGMRDAYFAATTNAQRRAIVQRDRMYKTAAAETADDILAQRAGKPFADNYGDRLLPLRAEEWLQKYEARLRTLEQENQTPEALLDGGAITHFTWDERASKEQAEACVAAEREHVRRRIRQMRQSLRRGPSGTREDRSAA